MIENPCIKCKEHCCIGPIGTFITIRDAKRIADYTKMPMSEFCFYGNISKDKKWQKELVKDRDHSYFKISDRGKVLQLRARDNGECIFLKDLKCTVHEAKPLVCKIFPIGYRFDGSLCYFGEDSYCKFMDKDIEKTCAKIGLSVNEVKAIVRKHLDEVKEYKEYEKYFLEGNNVEEVWAIINK